MATRKTNRKLVDNAQEGHEAPVAESPAEEVVEDVRPRKPLFIQNLATVDGRPLVGPPYYPSTADVPAAPAPIPAEPEWALPTPDREVAPER